MPTSSKPSHPFDLFDNAPTERQQDPPSIRELKAVPKKEIYTKREILAGEVPPRPAENSTLGPATHSVFASVLEDKLDNLAAIKLVLNWFKEKPARADIAERILKGAANPDLWWENDTINLEPTNAEEIGYVVFKDLFRLGVKASLK